MLDRLHRAAAALWLALHVAGHALAPGMRGPICAATGVVAPLLALPLLAGGIAAGLSNASRPSPRGWGWCGLVTAVQFVVLPLALELAEGAA